MEYTKTEAPAKKKRFRGKKRILLLLAALLMLAFATVMVLHQTGYIRYPWEQAILMSGRAEKGPLPGMTAEELQEYLQKEADENYVNIQLNSKPVFPDGNSPGSLSIQNSQFNKFDMQVTIYEGDGEEGRMLYQSEKIPPDYHIEKDKLLVSLGKGLHPATAYVTFYEGDKQLTTSSFTIEISIEN